ncbi:hypothetical protein [uncultured Agrococcus sp.]|uniref:hypothetical protein n=1 Tax=uncultured Agrococcus sp. TaxID=382258 RepID=UPI0026011686|nr:hypothetical protein [uncultured Agrococcus sp.]
MTTRTRPLTAVVAVAATLALAGCVPGQLTEPDCPLVDYDVVISVTIESELEIDDVGICDDDECTTDDDIAEGSDVDSVYPAHSEGTTWNFSIIRWMPESARFVALVDGEELDLGWHDLEITHTPIVEGEDCGSIPSYEPLTIRA